MSENHPSQEQRKRVEQETLIDLQKPFHQLLADVHDESVNANSENAPITRTLARFASLQARLIIELEKRNNRTQFWFALLAIGSLILGFISLLHDFGVF